MDGVGETKRERNPHFVPFLLRWDSLRAHNHYTSNRTIMDRVYSHNLNADSSEQSAPLRTGRERIELQTKIQRLQWLLTECIGLEEYELCSQIRNIIQKKYELLSKVSSDSPSHYESTNETQNHIE